MGVSERWRGHPPLPTDLEERLEEIVERLRAGGAGLVYVFGSAAVHAGEEDGPKGPRRPPQDLDMAVWGLEEELDRLRPDIEDLLGTDRFDIVRMETADPELRYDVVARGRLVWARDPELENRVELAALREYRDMAPFRRKQREALRETFGVDGS